MSSGDPPPSSSTAPLPSSSTAFLFIEDMISDVMTRENMQWCPSFSLQSNRSNMISVFDPEISETVSHFRSRFSEHNKTLYDAFMDTVKSNQVDKHSLFYTNLMNSAFRYLPGPTDNLENFFQYCGLVSEYCVRFFSNGFGFLIPDAMMAGGFALNDLLSWNSKTDFSEYKVYASGYNFERQNSLSLDT